MWQWFDWKNDFLTASHIETGWCLSKHVWESVFFKILLKWAYGSERHALLDNGGDVFPCS